MNRKKIAIVFGTRPEAIKMAPVIKEFQKHQEKFDVTVISTAQHRQMLDQVLKVFNIEPDFDLNVMKPKQTLSDITADVLKRIEKIYLDISPDMVLVHGDTTTSYAAALAAFYLRIPIGHVEAGLRTHDKYFPFPEEMNRQMIDNLADLYFVPTEAAAGNLEDENKNMNNVFVTGNTVIDAVHYTKTLKVNHPILSMMHDDNKWFLLTMHRRENYGQPMDSVFKAVKKLLEDYEDIEVIMPVHLSPIVQNQVKEAFLGTERIHLIEPQEVDVFHNMIKNSTLILTDSGGLQEEAPALDIPVLVLRDITERPEGVEAGTLKVVGTDEKNVYNTITHLLENKDAYKKMAQAKNPYGDGLASERILKIIRNFLAK